MEKFPAWFAQKKPGICSIKSYFCNHSKITRYDENNLTIRGEKLYYILNKTNARSFIFIGIRHDKP